MKDRTFLVKKAAKNVRLVKQDLRGLYGVEAVAEKTMEELLHYVSPQLYGMLMEQLLAFHEDMQQEMADDLVTFATDHVAYTTGCPSADAILDVCYMWIAIDHGITKNRFERIILNHCL